MMAFTPPHPRWNDPRYRTRSPSASPHLRGSPSFLITQDIPNPLPALNHGSEWGSYFSPPSMKPRLIVTPTSFVPIERHEEGEIGSVTPLYNGKPSPATSLRTITTVDSRDSLPTLDSPSHGFSVIRTGFQTIYLPPKDITVCRSLENNFDEAIFHRQRKTPSPRELKKASGVRDEDAVRKSRLKTELCMHYESDMSCPFGESCTYAHGVEELQLTKLMDLHRAGLADFKSYRVKPCLSYISTGSCPFGKRCSSIHDPRVAGTQQSWLPHTETQGNTIATDINVEALHQKRLNEILYNNPFGESFSLEADTYDDLYKLVCNTKPTLGKKRRPVLAEHHKVDIALQMRGPPGWKYKYRPQHIIYDELCMVIQKRAFRLTEEEAIEIPLSMCRRTAVTPFTYVIVREMAFGPDSDSTVRGVALWFDISEDDVTVCTPQQAKRFRWKKPLRNRSNKPSPTNSNMKNNKNSPMSFDTKDCFFMIRPYDTDAYNLVSGMLYHRLGVLRTKRIPQLTDRSVALKTLTKHDAQLRNLFEHLVQYWTTWAWPVNEGREHVDGNTPAPPIDGKYWHHGASDTGGSDDDVSSLGTNSDSVVKRIWESFVAAGFDDAEQKNSADDDETVSTKGAGSKRRLAVFEALSGGVSLSDDSVLPHIKTCRLVGPGAHVYDEQESERCWKALLIKPMHLFETNEWEAVREHFVNSRSTRVLSILQQ